MSRFDAFWRIMEMCDWDQTGDDTLVLAPVIRYLAAQEDSAIFSFDDAMTELLWQLDTKKLAKQCKRADRRMSDDSFLYSRCVALINGEEYFKQALAGKCPDMWRMEFESLLYVPQRAWAEKHSADEDDYPHIAPFSYETGSNAEGWK